MNKREIKVGNFTLILDPNDPHTPAMIEHKTGASGTYDCVMDMGELEKMDGTVIKLSDTVWNELNRYRDDVEDAFAAARPHGWDY